MCRGSVMLQEFLTQHSVWWLVFYYVLVYLFSLGLIWLYVLSPVSLFSYCMFRFLPCLCLLNMLFMLLCLHRVSLSSIALYVSWCLYLPFCPFLLLSPFVSRLFFLFTSPPLVSHFMSPLSVMCHFESLTPHAQYVQFTSSCLVIVSSCPSSACVSSSFVMCIQVVFVIHFWSGCLLSSCHVSKFPCSRYPHTHTRFHV